MWKVVLAQIVPFLSNSFVLTSKYNLLISTISISDHWNLNPIIYILLTFSQELNCVAWLYCLRVLAEDRRWLAKVKQHRWNIVILLIVIGCFVWRWSVVTMYCGMFHQRALLPDYARRCLEEVRPGVGPQPRSVQPPTPGAHHPRYLGHRSHSVDTGQGQWP